MWSCFFVSLIMRPEKCRESISQKMPDKLRPSMTAHPPSNSSTLERTPLLGAVETVKDCISVANESVSCSIAHSSGYLASEDDSLCDQVERRGFPGKVWGPVELVFSAAYSERKVAGLIPDNQTLLTPLSNIKRQSLHGWPTIKITLPLERLFDKNAEFEVFDGLMIVRKKNTKSQDGFSSQ